MTRSLWKGNFVNPAVFRARDVIANSLIPAKFAKKTNAYFIWDRKSCIPAYFLNKRVAVHSGKRYNSFIVKKSMVDHKFGEFALTKAMGQIIHTHKKKKKKK